METPTGTTLTFLSHPDVSSGSKGAFFLKVHWPGHDADYLLHLVLKLIMCGAILSLPHISSWYYAKLSVRISLLFVYEAN